MVSSCRGFASRPSPGEAPIGQVAIPSRDPSARGTRPSARSPPHACAPFDHPDIGLYYKWRHYPSRAAGSTRRSPPRALSPSRPDRSQSEREGAPGAARRFDRRLSPPRPVPARRTNETPTMALMSRASIVILVAAVAAVLAAAANAQAPAAAPTSDGRSALSVILSGRCFFYSLGPH